jgi:hypothetical protein
MSVNDTSVETAQNWKPKVLLMGGTIGALLGLGAAYLMIQKAEKENRPLSFTTGEGIKLGLLALGTLRQVTRMGGSEKE